MWYNKYFGANGMGYCIEYDMDESIFYPDKLCCMKVVYDDSGYDATDLLLSLKK